MALARALDVLMADLFRRKPIVAHEDHWAIISGWTGPVAVLTTTDYSFA